MKRITPENITVITSDMRILIGTNESGVHAAGIARIGHENWGLQWGVGFGPSGFCFGLPTKDWTIRQLPLSVIEQYVERYIDYCQISTKLSHYVTKVGCGLAGYTVPDIAPFFQRCRRYNNMWLPQDFMDFYNGEYKPPVETKTIQHGRSEIDNDNDSRHGYGRFA